jgi:hypothetical protein
VFFVFAQQRAELEERESQGTYDQVLEKVAHGDI